MRTLSAVARDVLQWKGALRACDNTSRMGLLVYTLVLLVFGALAVMALRADKPLVAAEGQPAEASLDSLLGGWSATLSFYQAAQRNLLVLRLTALAAFLAGVAGIIAGWEVSTLEVDHLAWFLYLPFGLWIAAGMLDLTYYLPAVLTARRAMAHYATALKPWGGSLQTAAEHMAAGLSPRRSGAAALLFYAVPAAVLTLLLFWFLPQSVGDEAPSVYQNASLRSTDESRA